MIEDKKTKDGKTRHWIFHPSRPYFYHDPEGDGFMYFATSQERDKAADEAIKNYLDDGWAEEVVYVMAGKVTHRATQTDLVKRPPDEELDEDNCDGEGRYWDADWDAVCNYKLLPV